MTPAITTQAAEAATRSRKAYSAQEKADYLALFEQSAMSPADFCRAMALNEATSGHSHRRAAMSRARDGRRNFRKQALT